MVTITIMKTNDNDICGIEIVGHASYANKGFDIVCATVSSVTQYMIGVLETMHIKCFEYFNSNEAIPKVELLMDKAIMTLPNVKVVLNEYEAFMTTVSKQYEQNMNVIIKGGYELC